MATMCLCNLLLWGLVSVSSGSILATSQPASATFCRNEFREAERNVVLDIRASDSLERIANAHDLESCKELCLQNDFCRSVTFFDSTAVKVCYLNRVNQRDDGTQTKRFNTIHSVTLVERDCSVEWSLSLSSCTQQFDMEQPNTALKTGDNDKERKSGIITIEKCKQLCLLNRICRSVTYQHSNQICYLNKVNHRDDGVKKLTSRGMTLVERVCSEPLCGISSPQHPPIHDSSRIVGGEEANPHSWPWMVALRFGANITYCGGSVVSDRWIVTAAHCFYTNSGKMSNTYLPHISIVAGIHNKRRPEDSQRVRSMANIYIHPLYDSVTQNNDIALVELETELEYSHEILPICLPKVAVEPYQECVATGWGKTQSTGKRRFLNQVKVPVIPHDVCSRGDYYSSSVNATTMFCAGYEQGIRDSCKGDSGGPLACLEDSMSNWHRYRLHGVTSWGKGCALRKKPGVYTNVIAYIEWIQQVTNGAFQIP